jgi:hypothetical protein
LRAGRARVALGRGGMRARVRLFGVDTIDEAADREIVNVRVWWSQGPMHCGGVRALCTVVESGPYAT